MPNLTEDASGRFTGLDQWSSLDAVTAMYEGQLAAIASLQGELEVIAYASDRAAARLIDEGRLVYVGAGTSGRLAVLDGVELGPTFGWPAERVAYCLAGGVSALTESAEGAEDNRDDAQHQLERMRLTERDVVIGVAASGTTPFTVAALKFAKSRRALTIGIANNAKRALVAVADHGIVAATGNELVAGSTRMKAGTAQKVTLNLLSTCIMLRLGRVYRGYMVDMVVSNRKLEKRAVGMVRDIADVTEETAKSSLAATSNNIKAAILVSLGNSPEASNMQLTESRGDLHAALQALAARS